MAVVAATLAERIVATGDITTILINQTPVRIRIDPAGTAMPLIDQTAADRAKLKHTMFGFAFAVGPQIVMGATRVTPLDFGNGSIKRRVGWTVRRFSPMVEGVVGPGGLPDPAVRFRLRASLAGERAVSMPMVDQGGMLAGWGERFATVLIDGKPVRVMFDPYHRRTLATAGAAVRIAAARGGTMTGSPAMTEIAFGIERPVREMVLARPLPIGPFVLSRIGVRTSDFGSAAAIPDQKADPDEVIVTAKGKHDPKRDRINIGSDLLDHCSSILFDNAHNLITLTCV
jgi:hypothetical protein